MTVVATADLVASAQRARGGVLAFNVITLEHAEAIVDGAVQAGRAMILQISHNAVRYHGALHPIATAAAAIAAAAPVDVALHLDHVEELELLYEAHDAGFSSAMFDAAALPYRENAALTRAAARWAHDNGLWLEAELGYVGGKADVAASAHAAGVRTDPQQAAEFVAETGVDALAVAVGNAHAMTSTTAALDLALIERIAHAVPVPLVLHGSSGVSTDHLRAAVRAGIVKVNIGTALNVACTDAVRESLRTSDYVDPRRYLGAGRSAMRTRTRVLLESLTTP